MAKETKRERFKRIAENRTNKILDDLRLLGNCSSSNYEYTNAEVAKIFNTLERELKATKAKFLDKDGGAERFTLED